MKKGINRKRIETGRRVDGKGKRWKWENKEKRISRKGDRKEIGGKSETRRVRGGGEKRVRIVLRVEKKEEREKGRKQKK